MDNNNIKLSEYGNYYMRHILSTYFNVYDVDHIYIRGVRRPIGDTAGKEKKINDNDTYLDSLFDRSINILDGKTNNDTKSDSIFSCEYFNIITSPNDKPYHKINVGIKIDINNIDKSSILKLRPQIVDTNLVVSYNKKYNKIYTIYEVVRQISKLYEKHYMTEGNKQEYLKNLININIYNNEYYLQDKIKYINYQVIEHDINVMRYYHFSDQGGCLKSLFFHIENMYNDDFFTDKTLKLSNKVYVFYTGDTFDRGSDGIECLYILQLLKSINEYNFFMTQGNHEIPGKLNFMVEDKNSFLSHNTTLHLSKKEENFIFCELFKSLNIVDIYSAKIQEDDSQLPGIMMGYENDSEINSEIIKVTHLLYQSQTCIPIFIYIRKCNIKIDVNHISKSKDGNSIAYDYKGIVSIEADNIILSHSYIPTIFELNISNIHNQQHNSYFTKRYEATTFNEYSSFTWCRKDLLNTSQNNESISKINIVSNNNNFEIDNIAVCGDKKDNIYNTDKLVFFVGHNYGVNYLYSITYNKKRSYIIENDQDCKNCKSDRIRLLNNDVYKLKQIYETTKGDISLSSIEENRSPIGKNKSSIKESKSYYSHILLGILLATIIIFIIISKYSEKWKIESISYIALISIFLITSLQLVFCILIYRKVKKIKTDNPSINIYKIITIAYIISTLYFICDVIITNIFEKSITQYLLNQISNR